MERIPITIERHAWGDALIVAGAVVTALWAGAVGASAELHPAALRSVQAADAPFLDCGSNRILLWSLIAAVLLQSVAIALLLRNSRQCREAERLQREELNRTLELRISEEVERGREKDRLMLQQSRFAAMGEMIGNIAHQWRQPLNMLGIVIQQIQMEQEKGVMTDRLMEERVGKGMDLLLYLSRTIDDFRSFFRPQVAAAPFSLAKAVVKTVSFFEASCADHNIKITIEGKSDLTYTGHVNEFSQAILNILNNARDALLETGAGDPAILVRMQDVECRSVVTVKDNAGGIDPKIIDKIFDPYFTTKEEGKGTGIGLYMAKSIIDRNMQGRISVRNLADGAEFTIVI